MVEYSVCYIMDNFIYSAVSILANYAYEYPILTLILSVIITMTMRQAYLTKLACYLPGSQFNYDYGTERGPHTWEIIGSNNSPINIDKRIVEVITIHEKLMWNHYNDLPIKVTIENNGHTVILRADYAANKPTLSGADLFHSYIFDSLCFHWSFSNEEGSEHTIDNRKYAMEIQAIHKTEISNYMTNNNNTLIIAYLFEVSAYNPFLDPIIQNLHRITKPGTSVEIFPFPLAWLCIPFKSEFYSYGGSTTTPPCQDGVEWFINSEPISISEQQLMEFRSLLSSNGTSKIIRNSRPVQHLNNRIVRLNKHPGLDVMCDISQQHLSDAIDSDENII